VDVKTAFLHGELKEEIYMELPDVPEKLLKSMEQASKQWNMKLKSVLEICGCIQSTADPCLFYKESSNFNWIYILVYVDDVLIVGDTLANCKKVTKALKSNFTISEMGAAILFLGLRINRDRRGGTMDISQVAFIMKMLKRFGLDNNDQKVPMDPGVQFKKATEE